MTVPVLNLIPQKHSLTTSRTAVSHGKIGRQLRALVRVLQRNVFSTLRQVGEAPAKPSYFLSLWLDTDAQQVCGRRKGQRCTIAVPDMIVEMDPVGDQLSISVTGIA